MWGKVTFRFSIFGPCVIFGIKEPRDRPGTTSENWRAHIEALIHEHYVSKTNLSLFIFFHLYHHLSVGQCNSLLMAPPFHSCPLWSTSQNEAKEVLLKMQIGKKKNADWVVIPSLNLQWMTWNKNPGRMVKKEKKINPGRMATWLKAHTSPRCPPASLSSCMSMGTFLNISVPQLPHL